MTPDEYRERVRGVMAELVQAASQAVEAFRALPEATQRAAYRWAFSMHRPVDIYGDQSVAYCTTCRMDWPCTEWLRLVTGAWQSTVPAGKSECSKCGGTGKVASAVDAGRCWQCDGKGWE